MTFLKAIIISIFRCFVEPFSVSGNGQSAVLNHLISKDTGFGMIYEVMLNLVFMVVLIIVLRTEILKVLKGMWGIIVTVFLNFILIFKKKGNPQLQYLRVINSNGRKMALMLIFAIVPMIVLNCAGYRLMLMVRDTSWVTGLFFIISGALVFLSTRCDEGNMGFKAGNVGFAFAAGIGAGAAILPGISLIAAVSAIMIILGYKRKVALRFSFVLLVFSLLINSITALVHIGGTEAIGSKLLPAEIVGCLFAVAASFFGIKIYNMLKDRIKMIAIAAYSVFMGLVAIIVSIAS